MGNSPLHSVVLGLWLTMLGSISIQAQDVQFSVERGFYDTPFQVELTTSLSNASIYFTLDGSRPTLDNSILYSSPIDVATTTVLRAMAHVAGQDAPSVSTHTYLFLADVIRQPGSVPGWPQEAYPTVGGDPVVFDYEMDPAIVDDPAYRDDILPALKAIPTLSLVMKQEDLWRVHKNLVGLEKPVSIELLYPNAPWENKQIDGGLVGHSDIVIKRSFRLTFRREHGPTKFESKIFRKAPLNGESATDTFDRIVLRAGNDRSWSSLVNEGRVAYTRDQWYRDTQIAMSGIGSHGTFVHLYVNGLYWGLYNPVERPDAWFTSAYLGGEKEDWFAINHGGKQGGDDDRWDYLTETLVYLDLQDPMQYQTLQDHLNIDHFIDYLALTWISGMNDWPKNNWWAGHRTDFPDPVRFFGWDGEWSWDTIQAASPGAWVHESFRPFGSVRTNNSPITNLWHAARQNKDFMMRFADRVYYHTTYDGALTDANARARWATLNAFIEEAVIAESARWGDTVVDQGLTLRTRDQAWRNEVARIDSMMNGNADRFLLALRQQQYYPDLDPPLFHQEGTALEARQFEVAPGYQLQLVNPNAEGSLYYTLSGKDPRQSGGSVIPDVLEGPATVAITKTTSLKARVKRGDTWSALHEVTVLVDGSVTGLKISEIMYHPPDEGDTGGEAFEFIEIVNTGTQAQDLTGVTFTDGIQYSFPGGAMLQAGAYLVLASNAAMFEQKNGFAPFGFYEGRLNNAGERIALSDGLNHELFAVTYDDEAPWPVTADGEGYSLELVTLQNNVNPDDPANWRASTQPGGTPTQSTPVAIENIEGPPDALDWEPASPNPFSTQTTIHFSVSTPQWIRADLYDMLGRQMQTVYEGYVEAGTNQRIEISSSDLSSGLYHVRLQGDYFVASQQVIFVK